MTDVDERELIAAIALKRCGAWCRRRSGDPRWRQRLEPDWEQVATVAALRVTTRFRPGGDGLPHRNFIDGCCRIALSDLTRTARRRAAAGFDEEALRVPMDLDPPHLRTPEPWVEAILNEELSAPPGEQWPHRAPSS